MKWSPFRLILPLFLLFPALAPAASPESPKVVLLLGDDLGYKDIGCYGGPVKTPALDGLAAKGTRFQTFYSGCAVCSPSRAVMLTGREGEHTAQPE